MQNASIPVMDDYYACIDIEFPQDKDRHIIDYQGILDGSPENVHHMVRGLAVHGFSQVIWHTWPGHTCLPYACI